MRRKIILITYAVLCVLLVFSCKKQDVGSNSIKSFEEMLDVMQTNVTFDENAGWLLRAPDNTTVFLWGNYCVLIEFEAKPFLDAGLDLMPQGISYDGKTFVIGTMLWLNTPEDGGAGESSPLASYERIVSEKRDIIGYHGAADHYGVNVGGGNMFEWAKDMGKNDKDIVFVLNPQPFIDAGVDPNRIEGWVFAKVTIDDENGKSVEVDKLLKPFNLR
jgi:hypothetical protein